MRQSHPWEWQWPLWLSAAALWGGSMLVLRCWWWPLASTPPWLWKSAADALDALRQVCRKYGPFTVLLWVWHCRDWARKLSAFLVWWLGRRVLFTCVQYGRTFRDASASWQLKWILWGASYAYTWKSSHTSTANSEWKTTTSNLLDSHLKNFQSSTGPPCRAPVSYMKSNCLWTHIISTEWFKRTFYLYCHYQSESDSSPWYTRVWFGAPQSCTTLHNKTTVAAHSGSRKGGENKEVTAGQGDTFQARRVFMCVNLYHMLAWMTCKQG